MYLQILSLNEPFSPVNAPLFCYANALFNSIIKLQYRVIAKEKKALLRPKYKIT